MTVDRPRRKGRALLACLVLSLAVSAAPALAATSSTSSTSSTNTRPRASFTQVQGALMCVACHEALPVARSPEAYNENAYVRRLIAQGETQPQILRTMVASYGPSVLAQPPASGFNVLIYVVPPVVVLVGLITLALTIPKWRRRAREAAAPGRPPGDPARLSPQDATRLDAELARRR